MSRFYCHACSRPTQAVRSGSNEYVCVRCGVVGFVEEIERRTAPQPSRNGGRPPDRSASISDPFQLMRMLFREVNNVAQVTQSPDRRVTVISGGGGPDAPGSGFAFLGPEVTFLPFLPDALDAILTPENIDNLLNHILSLQAAPGSQGPPPAAEEVRKNLWKETLSAEKAAAGGECAVCQESFKEGEEVTHITREVQKCPHFFHTPCIMPWLELHNTCCVCRYQLPTDDANYERQRHVIQSNLSRSLSSRPTSTDNGLHQRPRPVQPRQHHPPGPAHPPGPSHPPAPSNQHPSGYSVRWNEHGRAQVAHHQQQRATAQGLQLVGSRDEPSYAHLARYNEARPITESPLAAARARQVSAGSHQGLSRTGPSVDVTGILRLQQQNSESLAYPPAAGAEPQAPLAPVRTASANQSPPRIASATSTNEAPRYPVGRGRHPLAEKYGDEPIHPAQTAPSPGSSAPDLTRQPQPYSLRAATTVPRGTASAPRGNEPTQRPTTNSSHRGAPRSPPNVATGFEGLRQCFSRLFSHGSGTN